jgi:hypothetical protein
LDIPPRRPAQVVVQLDPVQESKARATQDPKNTKVAELVFRFLKCKKRGRRLPPSLFHPWRKQIQLHELPDKKLIDLLRTFQRLAVDNQYRHRHRAGERDEFRFIVGVFPNILFCDLILTVQIGQAVEHALRETAFVVEVKFHRHRQTVILY